MLGDILYYFAKYGDVIAKAYGMKTGRLIFRTDLSGEFRGYYHTKNILIFSFNNIGEAKRLFRKEIRRLP